MKVVSKKNKTRNKVEEPDIVSQLKDIDTGDLPNFENCVTPLEMGFWVLAVAKEKLDDKELTADQIAAILRDIKEVSIDTNSIVRAFARAGKQLYSHREHGKIYYKIMKSGKEHLKLIDENGDIVVFYFEAGKKYSSKKILSEEIITDLEGELRIVDPWCGERTLDCLRNDKGRKIKFLTRIENLSPKDREQFQRELNEFKTENLDIEFRNYPNIDLHDRYIISSSSLVILGYSIKDLGNKESFAIILKSGAIDNILEAVTENFNRRWKLSTTI